MEFGYAGGLTRQLVWAAAAVAAIEIPVAHLLLTRVHAGLAWAITGASLLLVVWILVDWIAATRRPIRILDDALVIPRGLRAATTVGLEEVTGARIVPGSDGLTKDALRTLYGAEATAVIETRGGAHAVSADDPAALVRAVTEAVATREG